MDGIFFLYRVHTTCLQVSAYLVSYLALLVLMWFVRWGVAPIVREAQNELSLDFPEQLDVPWSILQRHFGVTSSGGNLTSNIFYAVNERKEMEYSCTVGMSEDHRRTEQINALLFYNLEERVRLIVRYWCLLD